MGEEERKILVTTAWPYGNGPIHLGHFTGMVLPADIFARYHRMKGNDVAMVSGTDMHGTPIALKAQEEGKSPEELSEKYHKVIKNSLEKMGASYDLYTKTTTINHLEIVKEFFLTLKENNYLYKKSMELLYCENDDRFLPDRFVEGKCPYCGAEDARGDQCDNCGRTLDPLDLEEPYCTICGEKPVVKESEHHFLKLKEFEDLLSDWIGEKKGEWKNNVINFTEQWLDDGLEDRPITRDMEWGVSVPGDEEEKSIYVWFDAVIGYLSATKEYTDEWERFWKDREAETYYFIGKYNIPFHSIIWPSMLMGMEKNLNLPYCVCANEFLNLEGKQFSTSRNWAVWLNEVSFNPDLLRYYLTAIMPEKGDSNFTWENFQEKINEELVSTFGNFVYRVLKLVENNYDMIPRVESLDEGQKKIIKKINQKTDNVGAFIDKREFKKALQEFMSLSQTGNKFLNEEEPWKKENPEDSLYVSLRIVKALSILAAPFMPEAADDLWKMLGEEGSVHDMSWEDAKSDLSSSKLGEISPLFEKIDKEEIKKQKSELGNGEDKKMKKISIQDFGEIDLRIGEVLDAEKIEGSDELLKLLVDIGEEERQLVAGLAKTHEPKKLIGREVAEIFGVESQGMVLAAEEDGEPVLIEPEKDVKIGSEIK